MAAVAIERLTPQAQARAAELNPQVKAYLESKAAAKASKSSEAPKSSKVDTRGANTVQPAAPASRAAASVDRPATRRASTSSPSSSPPAAATFPWPDVSNFEVPGGSVLVKALVVLGILILGLMFYSKVTGTPIMVGLSGLSAGVPRVANPNALQPGYAQTAASATMQTRIAKANPARAA